jgi:hypothetical protein
LIDLMLSWPARLSGHRQLPCIGIQWQQFGGELEGFDFWSVPIPAGQLSPERPVSQTQIVRN